MPQASTIALTDRAATPVDHSFEPNGRKNGVAVFATREGVLAGAKRLTASVKTTTSRSYCELRLVLPVVETETINGVSRNVVTRTNRATVVFDFANASSLQERKDLIGMIEDALKTDQTGLDVFFTQAEDFH